MEWSIGMEWSQILEWKYSCTFHHRIQQNMCQSQKRVIDKFIMVTVYQFFQTYFGVECWSGVESNFGVAVKQYMYAPKQHSLCLKITKPH